MWPPGSRAPGPENGLPIPGLSDAGAQELLQRRPELHRGSRPHGVPGNDLHQPEQPAPARQDCPPNQFGIFFHGTGQQYLPLGDGYLCVTPPINRLPVINTGAAGTPSWVLDLSSAGGATSGETWSFSFWFRDPPGGGGGPVGNNLSDGLSVFFCP